MKTYFCSSCNFCNVSFSRKICKILEKWNSLFRIIKWKFLGANNNKISSGKWQNTHTHTQVSFLAPVTDFSSLPKNKHVTRTTFFHSSLENSKLLRRPSDDAAKSRSRYINGSPLSPVYANERNTRSQVEPPAYPSSQGGMKEAIFPLLSLDCGIMEMSAGGCRKVRAPNSLQRYSGERIDAIVSAWVLGRNANDGGSCCCVNVGELAGGTKK